MEEENDEGDRQEKKVAYHVAALDIFPMFIIAGVRVHGLLQPCIGRSKPRLKFSLGRSLRKRETIPAIPFHHP